MSEGTSEHGTVSRRNHNSNRYLKKSKEYSVNTAFIILIFNPNYTGATRKN